MFDFLKQQMTASGASEPERSDGYKAAVAAAAIELGEDYLLFPNAVLMPLTARGAGAPGMSDRPWSRISADVFLGSNAPLVYSLTAMRQPPDAMRSSLRARRTLMEGFLLAAAEKTGRRPSMAERATDSAMDAAESQLALGRPIYKVSMLAALYANRTRFEEVEAARRTIEARLRTAGLTPQRLYYVVERALHYFQPGGRLFPGLDEPSLFPEEVVPLIPKPSRQIMPAPDSVWIGLHGREGRDVHFSFTAGLDPNLPPPPHALTLILGEMGSGKTTLMRWIMLQRLLQGRTILSIDPEGENNALCRAVGGRVVPAGIPDDPDTCLIHPLKADKPDEMLLAVRFLVAALSGEAALTPGVQAVLHEAVRRRWERRPGEPMSLADLVDILGTLAAPEAIACAAMLRPYMRGSLFDGFFDRPKALLTPNFPAGQWWNFDLSTLRDQNREVVHAVLAWFLYHAVTVGRKPMDIYIDEGWRLLRGGPFTDLLDELGRRARKRGVGVMLLTHMPQDLARSATSMSLASTAFIGRVGREEAYHFFRSVGVTEAEAEANAQTVSRLPPRVFLAAPSGGRGALFPVLVTVPKSWLEFWERIGASTDGARKLNE